MDMATLVSEVTAWTDRPDLVGATRSAIRRVTLDLHRKHAFWRDLAIVNKTALNQVDSVPLTDFVRFRGLSHVVDNVRDKPISVKLADDLWDPLNGLKLKDFVFAAGNTLNISLAAPSASVSFFYFQDPIIDTATYSSWIADTQPDAIITGAVMRIMSERGETAIAQVAANAYREEEASLLAVNNMVEIR